MNYTIEYFKLVKKDCRRSISVWFVLLISYVTIFLNGIFREGWLYLIMVIPIIITIFAIINDIKRLNNAEIYLDEHKETINE